MKFSNLDAPSAALRVCVDLAEDGRVSGKVYSQRVTQPIPFHDIGTLLLRLDEVLDQQNFPQAFQKTRSFTGRTGSVPAAQTPGEGMPLQAVAEAKGEVSTFDLYVLSRRSASWQGRVDWMDGSPSQSFSSALELMRMAEERILGQTEG